MNPVLETKDLIVRFGGVTAVDSVSLDCRKGQLTGLIGPNGAGKTTFIDAVTGFLPQNALGRVLLDGSDISGLAPHRISHLGLARTWQSLELFDDITVRNNLEVASVRLTPLGAVRDYFLGTRTDDRTDRILELLDLTDIADRHPTDLSQGQRKLVGVGRALVADAELLLLDEPAAGLDRNETTWLGDRLRSLIDAGYTMLLVDHDMSLVLRVCDRIHVLEYGSLIATGSPDEIRGDPRVISAYLGATGGGQ
jgi:ABC-type branched-subunit amino acid transport system ATPase component